MLYNDPGLEIRKLFDWFKDEGYVPETCCMTLLTNCEQEVGGFRVGDKYCVIEFVDHAYAAAAARMLAEGGCTGSIPSGESDATYILVYPRTQRRVMDA